jgi:hypothetical protein
MKLFRFEKTSNDTWSLVSPSFKVSPIKCSSNFGKVLNVLSGGLGKVSTIMSIDYFSRHAATLSLLDSNDNYSQYSLECDIFKLPILLETDDVNLVFEHIPNKIYLL